MMIGDMEEKSQKERSESLISEAVIWKWKKGAYQARNIELFGSVSDIEKELLVFNGTTDKVHVQTDYPKLAKEMPKGRFFFMKTHEKNRERLMGIVLKEFAKVGEEEKIPEKSVYRQMGRHHVPDRAGSRVGRGEPDHHGQTE